MSDRRPSADAAEPSDGLIEAVELVHARRPVLTSANPTGEAVGALVVAEVVPAGADLAPLPRETAYPPDRDPRLVYLASLGSEKGRRSQAQALRVVADAFGRAVEQMPWHGLRYPHVTALRARLAGTYAPASANKILAALKGVLREARRLGWMSVDDQVAACDVKPVKGQRKPKGRFVRDEEVAALLHACDAATNAGARDAALLAVLFGCGLRRAEVVDLDLRDLDPDDATISVRGKGNKDRTAYAEPTLPRLLAWLAKRGDEPGPLFFPIDRLDRIQRRRLTDAAVYVILDRLAKRAGIRDLGPHDARRTYVSKLLDAGVDLATVKRMAGHENVATTERYDRRSDDAARKAARLLKMT